MHECEKCGKPVWAAVPMNLAGGVYTWLCARCSTEWNEFCMLHLIYQRLRKLAAVMDSIIHARELSIGDPEMVETGRQYCECKLELYQVGLEWLGRES